MRLRALNLVLLAALAAATAGCTAAGRTGADWPGRVHRLPPWRTGMPALLVNVPETYERGLRTGDDFAVHLLRRPPDVAGPETASLAVYVGHHPREPRATDIREPVTIAGRTIIPAYQPANVLVMAPGAFLVIGLLFGLFYWIGNRRRERVRLAGVPAVAQTAEDLAKPSSRDRTCPP